jgi:hypothetical protein
VRQKKTKDGGMHQLVSSEENNRNGLSSFLNYLYLAHWRITLCGVKGNYNQKSFIKRVTETSDSISLDLKEKERKD